MINNAKPGLVPVVWRWLSRPDDAAEKEAINE